MGIFAEWLEVDTAEILATYAEGTPWIGGQPAVVSAAQEGGGRITYFGCCGDDAFHAGLLDQFLRMSRCTPVLPEVPEGVEVTQRVTASGDKRILLVNHKNQETSFSLPDAYTDLLTGEKVPQGHHTIRRYGCKLLVPEKA